MHDLENAAGFFLIVPQYLFIIWGIFALWSWLLAPIFRAIFRNFRLWK